ncbi:MAG: hypothetical protein IPI35_33205 [Deltaproteobacteria bacterium]|nr:hypothetical protein [Deltaproteobacteria bacterium]
MPPSVLASPLAEGMRVKVSQVVLAEENKARLRASKAPPPVVLEHA